MQHRILADLQDACVSEIRESSLESSQFGAHGLWRVSEAIPHDFRAKLDLVALMPELVDYARNPTHAYPALENCSRITYFPSTFTLSIINKSIYNTYNFLNEQPAQNWLIFICQILVSWIRFISNRSNI